MNLLSDDLVLLFVMVSATISHGVILLDSNKNLLTGRCRKYHQLFIIVSFVVFGLSLVAVYIIMMMAMAAKQSGG